MRHRRRNPEPVTLLLVAGAVAAGAFFLLRKKPGVSKGVITSTAGTPFLQIPDGVGRPPNFFDDFTSPGVCVAIVQGAAGFHIEGDIPNGEIVAMRTVSAVSNGVVMAESIDPRTPKGLPPVAVTPAMSAGAGDCF
jgi:hypothetical protein